MQLQDRLWMSSPCVSHRTHAILQVLKVIECFTEAFAARAIWSGVYGLPPSCSYIKARFDDQAWISLATADRLDRSPRSPPFICSWQATSAKSESAHHRLMNAGAAAFRMSKLGNKNVYVGEEAPVPGQGIFAGLQPQPTFKEVLYLPAPQRGEWRAQIYLLAFTYLHLYLIALSTEAPSCKSMPFGPSHCTITTARQPSNCRFPIVRQEVARSLCANLNSCTTRSQHITACCYQSLSSWQVKWASRSIT